MRFPIDRFRCPAVLCTWCTLLTLTALVTGRAQGAPQASAQTGPLPLVRVDYFEPERGYTVGRDDVTFLCVVRNVGGVALPDRSLRLHCLPLTGLDYTSGDTLPPIPALAPDQSAAFRWHFSATDETVTPVAAVVVEPMGATQTAAVSGNEATLAVVPRFDTLPRFGAPIAGVDTAPQVGFTGNEAWLSSNRIGVRALSSMHGAPLLLVAARVGADWQTTALSLPLMRILAAEEGQAPWWQGFRWRQTRTHSDKDTATLTLMGGGGDCWHVELDLTARRDTCALEGHLRLKARRPARCQAVQLPRLLVGSPERDTVRADGSAVLLPASVLSLPVDSRVAAVRSASGTTSGIAWPQSPPLAGWTWSLLPVGDPDAVQSLGVRAVGPAPGDPVLPGTVLEFSFRIFALAASDTVRDALRFALP